MGNCVDEVIKLTQENIDCVVLCLTEHWKSKSELELFNISGFKLVSHYCRDRGEHGGTAIYVKDEVKCQELDGISSLSEKMCFECAAIEMYLEQSKIYVVSVYCPPKSNCNTILQKLNCILQKIYTETVFVLGDFNLDFSKESPETHSVKSLFKSYNLDQKIFEYTRIQSSIRGISQSCIDNIFTNHPNSESQVLHTMISDHTGQKVSFISLHQQNHNYIFKRNYTDDNIANFKVSLSQVSWDSLYSLNEVDVNNQWDLFMTIFTSTFNIFFPVKKFYIKKKNCGNCPDVVSCKSELDLLYVLKNHDHHFNNLYNKKRTEYNKLLRRNRQRHIEDCILKSDNKSKTTWKMIGSILGQKPKVSVNSKGDPQSKAEEFNKYLIDSITDLTTSQNAMSNGIIHNLENNCKTIFIKPVSESEIFNIIHNLKNTVSCGYDGIPNKILRACANEFIKPLTWIINNSISNGIFPHALKLAVVTPVYKKSDPSDLKNFRPISVLPSFSKVFEKVICNRITEFLTTLHLFSENQHGYLKGRSTQTAVYQFTEMIYKSFEERNLPLGVFLDLSKAYDILNHNVICQKLESYGIRGKALDWCVSYLTGRAQKVKIIENGETFYSYPKQVSTGVPQGSIMGPLLFVICMNDISNVVTNDAELLINYADDTNMIVTAPMYPSLISRTSDLMGQLENWFDTNKLLLNHDKTNVILFSTVYGDMPSAYTINLNNNNLNLSNDTRFLGVIIDRNLNWTKHIYHLSDKLNRACYSMRVLSNYVDKSILKIVYHSGFESIVRYCITFWGCSSQMHALFVIQKRCIRTILKMSQRDSCRGKFKELKILTVFSLYVYECLVFVFKNKNLFNSCHPKSNYPMREFNYILPRHRLTKSQHSCQYKCMLFFNKLPNNIKTETSFKKYKVLIFNLLLDLELYSTNDYLNM